MKHYIPLGLAAVFLLGGFLGTDARAQQPDEAVAKVISSLSFQDKMKFKRARDEAFSQNPQLKAEQNSLNQERESLQNGATTEQKKAYFKDLVAHQKKMKAAMLQVDPSLAPIFDQIDQAVKEEVKQRVAAAGGN